MAGSCDTFTKFINLRDTTNLTNTRFTALCSLFRIEGMSDASLNRALQRKSFNHDVDVAVRPLVLLIEELIEAAKPFPISFENVEQIHTLLSLFNDGYEFSTTVAGSQTETK